MPTALLIAAFDSQLKWASLVGAELAERGFHCTYAAPADDRSALSPDQCAAVGVSRVHRLGHAELVDLAVGADVVVLALVGPRVRDFCQALTERSGERSAGTAGPVIVTGWVGVVIEKITAGYLDRCLADVVAVNAVHELEHFRDVARRLEIDPANLLLSGLPLLSPTPARPAPGPVRSIVYADQPTVPATAVDRLYVYRRLLAHARLHPDRRVVLKPRHRPDEDTFHRMIHHPQDLLAHEDVPPNFTISYRPVTELLAEADLLVTVSSTACLEAIDRGCRVALVLDLGLHERLGNQVFVESGLLRTFDQIDRDDLGAPDPDWVASWFTGSTSAPAEIIVDRIEKLLATGERPSVVVRDSTYQRAAREVDEARRTEPGPPSAWTLRRHRQGVVMGTAIQWALWWTPPVLQRPVRRWWNARDR